MKKVIKQKMLYVQLKFLFKTSTKLQKGNPIVLKKSLLGCNITGNYKLLQGDTEVHGHREI